MTSCSGQGAKQTGGTGPVWGGGQEMSGYLGAASATHINLDDPGQIT